MRQPAAGRERDAGRLDRRRSGRAAAAGRRARRRRPAPRAAAPASRAATVGVVVEEDHDVAAWRGPGRGCCRARSRGSPRCGATRTRSCAASAVERRGDLGRRAVVPDDHLDRRASSASERLDAGGGQLGVLVGRHDDGGQPGVGVRAASAGPVDEVPVEDDVAPVADRRAERAAAVREPAAYADDRDRLDGGAAAHQAGRAARPRAAPGRPARGPAAPPGRRPDRAGSISGAGVRKTTFSPLPRSPSSSSATNGRPSADQPLQPVGHPRVAGVEERDVLPRRLGQVGRRPPSRSASAPRGWPGRRRAARRRAPGRRRR